MKKISVLVVDDSAFMRRVITDIIESEPQLKVVDTAKNGKEAIEKIKSVLPDVVTMDVEMPIMDGITALKEIMQEKPVPIIMLSSLTQEGADATVKALSLGAVDFITKPTSIFKMNTEDMKIHLIDKIKIAAKVKLQSQNTFLPQQKVTVVKNMSHGSLGLKKIIAIGTSTGGPRALQEVLPYLPQNLPASILVVQHMPPGFTRSLAERLNSISQIHVKEAEDDDILQPGYAYIAPGDHHLKVIKTGSTYRIRLTQEEPVSGHRPSVDMMMNSLAQLQISNIMGVIMTGMGSDGAKGMKNLKNQKAYNIAQNEDTCVVYGMPKSAVNLGCIDEIIPLQEIAEKITKVVGV
ncbi:protein-glutamate methylesterase/protein-glutamine glutaminase [Geosporobacter ferrireducens]|uniref:Protein-glutamate methylesterase/protein-glutamine glutaminase n=1 Tax=Geosporobacter ferrireducens TaxID=1424294 RepID=A0A1D8GBG6_9FIRM|nr:chemotaxis response regulator protein-glutamate methylesterase [Geosporobacter ferrireducens]AOT68259.1 chemotaxis response regulator protein-glutamate methylesterase [Geosporobacter ferrireducens]MTI57319.1 chemotaxis response regulator protein-glutamate methylesterase [Geosporobacter ferrireducens]